MSILRYGVRALKKSFLSIWVSNLASKESQPPSIGQNFFVSKVPFVGTLNLCLKMPNTEQNTRIQSDHPGLRKRQKTDDKH